MKGSDTSATMASENKENEAPKQANAKAASKDTSKAQPKKTTKKRKSADAVNDSSNDHEEASEPTPALKKAKTTTTTKKSKDAEDALPDVSDIHLDGDVDDEAPVYATAVDIRRMINNKLKTPGVTQVKFCEMINKACNGNVTAHQLRTFRNKVSKGKGCAVIDGTDSPAFYAAWCYFEKLRIKLRKPKSKHQLEMEDAHGDRGISRRGNGRVIMMRGEHLYYDKYGKMVIE